MALAKVAILLAAGKARRFGSDKTRLALNGETLVQRHVRQLGDQIGRVVVVANGENTDSIRADFSQFGNLAPEIVIQQGTTAESGVLTGLSAAPRADDILIVCVNDLVPDEAYRRMCEAAERGTTIMVARSSKAFMGGCVELAPDDAVAGIQEKPEGGCQPGDWINVFIHRHGARSTVEALRSGLEAGDGYESVLTRMIEAGSPCRALRLDLWHPVKTLEDWETARRLFA